MEKNRKWHILKIEKKSENFFKRVLTKWEKCATIVLFNKY